MLKFLLPEGHETANHYFLSIDTIEDKNVGFIWLGALPNIPEESIFLFDIHIKENFRSKGIGRKALEQMDYYVKSLKYNAILLNVLKSNYARNLYASVGYETMEDHEHSLIMMKQV